MLFIVMVNVSSPLFAQMKLSYFERAKIELRNRDYTQALQNLNYAIIQSDHFEAYFLRGLTKYNLGDLKGAEKDYTECIKRAPLHKEAFHYRAIVRDRQYNFQEAFLDYDRALAIDSMDWRIYMNRSISNLFLQNFETVVHDCNKALKFGAKGEGVYVLRAMARTGLRQFDASLKDFETALRKNPHNLFAHIQRGICYKQMELPDMALRDFEWVLEKDSSNVQALFQRALLRMDNKENELALEDLDQVIALAPDNTVALFNRAILKSRMADYLGAIDDYNLVIQKRPDNILAYYNRGLVKQQTGAFKSAMEDYDKVIELYPEFSDAYYNRAQIKSELKDFRGAEKDYQFAQSLNEERYLKSDSLNQQEALKLARMITLSGRMPEEEDQTGKIQYDDTEIVIKPWLQLIPYDGYDKAVYYYDALNKDHYQWNLVGLTVAGDTIAEPKIHQAIEDLDRSTESQSTALAYYVKRATLYTYQKNYNKAFTDFNLSVKLDGNNLLSYFGRANARLKLRELLNEFEPETPTLAGNSTSIANITYAEHSYDEIIKDYNRVIELDPDFPFAYFNRAYVLIMNDDFQGGIKDLTRAIELKPDFAEAYFNRGLINIYLQNISSGCEDLSQAGELGLKEAYNAIYQYCNQ